MMSFFSASRLKIAASKSKKAERKYVIKFRIWQMPINSAYRVNLFLTSYTFWEFVSARIMNSNFKTIKYIADWKEKTDLIKRD